ncbi:hypothetical protein ACIQNG_12385 [Streptomyces sp. NPDC091377]|uniref:hypothetical protein n=1 Tax=Streptomyces sp. NPDC091377 TaxID=3365995 RepID=UPI0037F36F2E
MPVSEQDSHAYCEQVAGRPLWTPERFEQERGATREYGEQLKQYAESLGIAVLPPEETRPSPAVRAALDTYNQARDQYATAGVEPVSGYINQQQAAEFYMETVKWEQSQLTTQLNEVANGTRQATDITIEPGQHYDPVRDRTHPVRGQQAGTSVAEMARETPRGAAPAQATAGSSRTADPNELRRRAAQNVKRQKKGGPSHG